ncbi:hypothetical protein UY3_13085 [Chelonia mydas]|uniref:Uncharacterized protein n=1 Tax=Chelonia mydas TaxID=8469 RepID=M7BNQ3_CHEMY|nr:hypothetical protein UY3_13085 [Chelonia mydas]
MPAEPFIRHGAGCLQWGTRSSPEHQSPSLRSLRLTGAAAHFPTAGESLIKLLSSGKGVGRGHTLLPSDTPGGSPPGAKREARGQLPTKLYAYSPPAAPHPAPHSSPHTTPSLSPPTPSPLVSPPHIKPQVLIQRGTTKSPDPILTSSWGLSVPGAPYSASPCDLEGYICGPIPSKKGTYSDANSISMRPAE